MRVKHKRIMINEEVGEGNMAKRVFMNNLDTYASNWIAKHLSGCVPEESLSEETTNDGTFQIVGTVSKESDEQRPHVVEQYFQLEKDMLLQKLMECDIIIYNITPYVDDLSGAYWAILALSHQVKQFGRPKTFILISTVMTWALTKPLEDADNQVAAFKDVDYKRRKSHPNFQKHIELEKMVLKVGKKSAMLSTYVMATGLQYGMGEQDFHWLFKIAWLGQVSALPVYGDGTNVVPTIHISDLARVIQHVIDHRPEPRYLLAVDESNDTMEYIVKAISSALGTGTIQMKPFEDVYLGDLTQLQVDLLQVDLRMEAAHVRNLFELSWECRGLVKSMELVMEQYRVNRGLNPICVCVLGPPAVGKTTVAKLICAHYKLNHVTVEDATAQTISKLESMVKDDSLDQDALDEAKEYLSALKDAIARNVSALEDIHVIRVMKDMLMSKPCMNQGFVLDDFPKTREQAMELFFVEEEEANKEKAKLPTYIPETVFFLQATDDFLKERVINLPESKVTGTFYTYDQFPQRLASYRVEQAKDDNVVTYFEELGIMLRDIKISSAEGPDYALATQSIMEAVGRPRNYGPTAQELQEEEWQQAEAAVLQEARKMANKEREEKEAVEETERDAARWKEWTSCLEEVKRQQHEMMNAEMLPLKCYLLDKVMPTLAQGLKEFCVIRPPDAVDFLAEYLFKNNPQNQDTHKY